MKPSWTESAHEYQKRCLNFALTHNRAAIFPDMGLGKTSIMLEMIRRLNCKALVVAPLHVARSGWRDEMEKWEEFGTLTFKFLHGPKKDQLLATQTNVTTINPDGLKWLVKALPANKPWPFDVLIIDESSVFKSYNTTRFKTCLKPNLPRFSRRYILSGTPAPESAEDLWAQYYILDDGKLLGRYITHYRNRFFLSMGYGGYTKVLREGAWKEIISTVKDVTFRLDAKDYIQLPPVIENEVDVELPDAILAKYKSFEKEFFATVDEEEILADSSASASIKCRQIASGGVWLGDASEEDRRSVFLHESKLEALKTMLESLQGQQAIVVYEFIPEVAAICDYADLKASEVSIVGGTVSTSEAAENLERFKRGESRVLLAHSKSIGYGLNLQRCKHIIFFSLPWSLEAYTQLIARCHRQGQEGKVTVHYLLAKGTIDRSILGALRKKKREQENLLKGLE